MVTALRAIATGSSQSSSAATAEALGRIERGLVAVAEGNFKLRQENEELRRLAAEGCFQFVQAVAAVDFRYFAMIVALGDRAKAARRLGVKARTFYERVASWAAGGPAYRRMFAIVEARKGALRKAAVPLGTTTQGGGGEEPENPQTLAAVLEVIQSGKLDQADYPHLLQEILNALLAMNPRNWDTIRKELVPLLREDVPQ